MLCSRPPQLGCHGRTALVDHAREGPSAHALNHLIFGLLVVVMVLVVVVVVILVEEVMGVSVLDDVAVAAGGGDPRRVGRVPRLWAQIALR